MNCVKCGKTAPEGFPLCPSCAESADTEENGAILAEFMDVMNIANMGETDKSQRPAIKSMMNIAKRRPANKSQALFCKNLK